MALLTLVFVKWYAALLRKLGVRLSTRCLATFGNFSDFGQLFRFQGQLFRFRATFLILRQYHKLKQTKYAY